jgi:tRNA(fMet)-specific endonuclease VapC
LKRIGQALVTGDDVRLSIVTLREIMEGRIHEISRAKPPQKTIDAYNGLRTSAAFIASYAVEPFTLGSLARFEVLTKLRLNVAKDDLRTAAIALEAGAIVVTRNLRDFRRVPGLTCEDWSV